MIYSKRESTAWNTAENETYDLKAPFTFKFPLARRLLSSTLKPRSQAYEESFKTDIDRVTFANDV